MAFIAYTNFPAARYLKYKSRQRNVPETLTASRAVAKPAAPS